MIRDITFKAPIVTVSAVDITPDLKNAHIYISALGTDAQKRSVLEALVQQRVHLQSELAKRVVIKHTPHLHFRIDDSIERGTRVLSIMDEIDTKEED